MKITACTALALALAGCTGDGAPHGRAATASAAPSAPRPSFGNLMAEVGRRFELAGRAAEANRYELAAFEAREIREVFEDDIPGAELPKEGPTTHIPAEAKAFLPIDAELEKAATAKDAHAFELAFQHAAAACNGCHAASGKPFIQIPTALGKAVPDVEPVPPAR